MLELQNVSLTYDPSTKFKKEALVDINLKIQKGEAISIVGHVGSGKSSLVQLFNGLIKPDSGFVFLNGKDINKREFNSKEIVKTVGVVFQYPEEQFFAETVLEEVSFGPRNLGFSEGEARRDAYESLEIMGFNADEVISRSPFEFSGGEKRRIAIASIISMKPEILVLDEPTAGMDFQGTKNILSHINNELQIGTTVVIVTHNMDEALLISNRIVALTDGKIVFDGTPEEFFKKKEIILSAGLDVPFAVSFREKALRCFDDFPFCRNSEEILNFVLEKKVEKR